MIDKINSHRTDLNLLNVFNEDVRPINTNIQSFRNAKDLWQFSTRNKGVSLSSVNALFPMENKGVEFQWKVCLIYIKLNLGFPSQSLKWN